MNQPAIRSQVSSFRAKGEIDRTEGTRIRDYQSIDHQRTTFVICTVIQNRCYRVHAGFYFINHGRLLFTLCSLCFLSFLSFLNTMLYFIARAICALHQAAVSSYLVKVKYNKKCPSTVAYGHVTVWQDTILSSSSLNCPKHCHRSGLE